MLFMAFSGNQCWNSTLLVGLSKTDWTQETNRPVVIQPKIWLIQWACWLAEVLKDVEPMKLVWVTSERAWNLTNPTQMKTFSFTHFPASSSAIWRFLFYPHQYTSQILLSLPHSSKIFFFIADKRRSRLDLDKFGQIWWNLGQIQQNSLPLS